MGIKTTNFFQCWRVEGCEDQFKMMGPYRPTIEDPKEIRKAKFRNINMLLAVILRYPNTYQQQWRHRYDLKCDFALNGRKEMIFQRLGKKQNRAVIDLHHAIQHPNPVKGKAGRSITKKVMLNPNYDFRNKVLAYNEQYLLEFMTILLVSRSTHKMFRSWDNEVIDREWYANNEIELPRYWIEKKVFLRAIAEINQVFGTDYDPETMWVKFNNLISQ